MKNIRETWKVNMLMKCFANPKLESTLYDFNLVFTFHRSQLHSRLITFLHFLFFGCKLANGNWKHEVT